jgi:hypothetical protein
MREIEFPQFRLIADLAPLRSPALVGLQMAGEFAANMTPEERALLQEWSAPCSHIVEFGCGGSTLLFLETTSAVIDSVDNNKDWVERISAEPRPAEAISSGRLKICLVDTGPVGKWGLPTDEATRPLWRRYPCAVWNGLRPPAVDLVFVDGRFRVACTLSPGLQPPSHSTTSGRASTGTPTYCGSST